MGETSDRVPDIPSGCGLRRAEPFRGLLIALGAAAIHDGLLWVMERRVYRVACALNR